MLWVDQRVFEGEQPKCGVAEYTYLVMTEFLPDLIDFIDEILDRNLFYILISGSTPCVLEVDKDKLHVLLQCIGNERWVEMGLASYYARNAIAFCQVGMQCIVYHNYT